MGQKKQQYRVLIADDNPEELFTLKSILDREGYEVIECPDSRTVIDTMLAQLPDVALFDLNMPGLSGFDLVEKVKGNSKLRYIPVSLVTSEDDLKSVREGFSRGADDYIKKPYRREELLARTEALLRTAGLYQELRGRDAEREELIRAAGIRDGYGNLVGVSSVMQDLYSLIEKVRDADVPVLITGESGTGKELVARALHFQSVRNDKPFLARNCSAFSSNLLESELFGHVKGAFTGAAESRRGIFEEADQGTLFLDELGEMDLSTQVKLLRVVQDGIFCPVGSNKERKASVRIIAATNADLKAKIKEGSFREDLFYRLNVFNLRLPALRERTGDIELLVERFLDRISERTGKERKTISKDCLKMLGSYSWPGNVRELENQIERAVLMVGNEDTLEAEHLDLNGLSLSASDQTFKSSDTNLSLADALGELEKRLILKKLDQLNGNQSKAAVELGVSRSGLIAKMKKYGI